MTVWKKYLLLQIPSWILVAILLLVFHRWFDLSLWIAVGLLGLYVLKDFVLYPFLRKAYEPGGKTAAEQMVGNYGVVVKPLNPEGYVQVQGELWQARADPHDQTIPQGSRVRVLSVHDLTLIVCVAQDYQLSPKDTGASSGK